MSLFTTYSPATLYKKTKELTKMMYHTLPNLDEDVYFENILHLHAMMLREDVVHSEIPTIQTIYRSLQRVEAQLFGSTTDTFEVTVKGCYMYTAHIQNKLHISTSHCTCS
jgi:hypothetical protein